MTQATEQHDAVSPYQGIPVLYYPPLLSDEDLEHLRVWSMHCWRGPAPARRLGDYLRCICSLEEQRRDALERGDEIIEVSMTALPCHAWSNHEVAGALAKILSIGRYSLSEEIRQLFVHLENSIVAEVQHRLDPEHSITAGK